MKIDEAKLVVDKAARMIMGSKNSQQFDVSARYAELAYRAISSELGYVNRTKFVIKIERSIGFYLGRLSAQ